MPYLEPYSAEDDGADMVGQGYYQFGQEVIDASEVGAGDFHALLNLVNYLNAKKAKDGIKPPNGAPNPLIWATIVYPRQHPHASMKDLENALIVGMKTSKKQGYNISPLAKKLVTAYHQMIEPLTHDQTFWDSVADGAIDVMKNPAFSAVVGVATACIPGVGAVLAPFAVALQRGVTNMVDKARHGGLSAGDALSTVANIAAKGVSAASPAIGDAIDKGVTTAEQVYGTAKQVLAVARSAHVPEITAQLRGARTIVLRAKHGDVSARRHIMKIVTQAKAGHPASVAALGYITSVVHGLATGHIPPATPHEKRYIKMVPMAALPKIASKTYAEYGSADDVSDGEWNEEDLAESDDEGFHPIDTSNEHEDDGDESDPNECACAPAVGNGRSTARGKLAPLASMMKGSQAVKRAQQAQRNLAFAQSLGVRKVPASPSPQAARHLAFAQSLGARKVPSGIRTSHLAFAQNLGHVPSGIRVPQHLAMAKGLGGLHKGKLTSMRNLRGMTPQLAAAMQAQGVSPQGYGGGGDGGSYDDGYGADTGDWGSDETMADDVAPVTYGYADGQPDWEENDEPGTYGEADEDPRDDGYGDGDNAEDGSPSYVENDEDAHDAA